MPAVSKIKCRRPQGDDLLADVTMLDEAVAEHFGGARDSPSVPSLPPIKAGDVDDDAVGEGGGGGLFSSPSPASGDSAAGGAEGERASPAPGGGGGGLLGAPPASLANDFRGGQESWNAMLYQLLLYKAQRGDLNIPHNDTSYRLLYNWVQTQRKHYKLYQENKTSSTFLNADRIAVLDAIDFQWNVRGDSFWQKNFDSLVSYKLEHGDVRVPRLYTKNPKLGEWVTDQRRQWKSKMEGKPNMMTDERKAKLDELGFVWKVRDRADWNDRYEQLLEFKKENGHCVVPQHYNQNRALGKWVAKQREQYRFYREGKHSFLTEERIDLLKSVGFVWQIKGRGAKKAAAAKAASEAAASPEVKAEDVSEKKVAKKEEEEEENMKELSVIYKGGTPGAGAGGGSPPRAASAADDDSTFNLKDPPPLDGRARAEEKQPALNVLQQQPAAMSSVTAMGTGAKPSLPSLKDIPGLKDLPSLKDGMLGGSGGSGMPPLAPGGRDGGVGISLPSISQQQLLQANMAAIAAHASSNQNMVADLAAVLRLGGADLADHNTRVPLGDPRAVAALRAAQLGGGGNDPTNARGSFTSMI